MMEIPQVSCLSCSSCLKSPMTGLLHEIEIRRAKRALSEERVSEDIIQKIMTAATYAPSCFNNQAWRFVVIHEEEALEKARIALSDANYWVKKSSLLILVITKPDIDCQLKDRRDYALFDVGLATMNLMLQASKEGLIAHPIAGFKPTQLKESFGIPEDYILITVVVIGFPGDESHLNAKHLELEHSERDRKPESEVIMYNTWVSK